MDPVRSLISNGVVQIMHSRLGRGPTKSRTTVAPDVITVVLRDCLTTSERQLVAEGQTDLVLTLRRAYQASMRAELVELVEHLTGARVETFLSDLSARPDITVDIFIMRTA